VIFHAIQRLELDTGSSWKLQFDKEKKQQNEIQKSCNFQKYDLGKGHVVRWVVTGDSKAIWEKKILMGRFKVQRVKHPKSCT
jgi:hypothetical protein